MCVEMYQDDQLVFEPHTYTLCAQRCHKTNIMGATEYFNGKVNCDEKDMKIIAHANTNAMLDTHGIVARRTSYASIMCTSVHKWPQCRGPLYDVMHYRVRTVCFMTACRLSRAASKSMTVSIMSCA